MRSRRSLLAAGATGTLALSAGCLGFVLGTDPLEFTASRAAPSSASLEATGYSELQSTQELFEETVDVGVTREIRASYWLSTYSKAVDVRELVREEEREDGTDEDVDHEDDDVEADELEDLEEETEAELEELESQEVAFFVVISMPGIEVLGRSFNPLEGLGSEELIDELNSQSDDGVTLRGVEPTGSTTLAVLGDDRDVDLFEATTDVDGESLELELSITSFSHEEDLLVVFGGYPAELEAEGDDLETLIESLEHPFD